MSALSARAAVFTGARRPAVGPAGCAGPGVGAGCPPGPRVQSVALVLAVASPVYCVRRPSRHRGVDQRRPPLRVPPSAAPGIFVSAALPDCGTSLPQAPSLPIVHDSTQAVHIDSPRLGLGDHCVALFCELTAICLHPGNYQQQQIPARTDSVALQVAPLSKCIRL